MMILTNAATDKLQLITSAAADVDVVADWVDVASGVVTPGMTPTTITTATTTDVVPTPAASTYRNIKSITIRNTHATTSCDVTVVLNRGGTQYERHKTTLAPGEMLGFFEGLGWFKNENSSLLNVTLRVSGSDVVNATTSWADVTGLTYAVKAAKHYRFEAFLIYICNATTTGARFGINGPAMTAMRGSGYGTVTGSVTAAATSTPVAPVTAVDTSMIGAQTTGPATEVAAYISGWFNPSADGTFAVRCQSEVAVAAGLTVKTGSWATLREFDN